MAIVKPNKAAIQEQDKFINSAPDGHKPKGVRKGKKQQITLTIAPELLNKVDSISSKLGQSRAAIINMAIYHLVENGITLDAD